jgi:cytochrome bd ubiquinol oxidase subunit II
MMAGVIGFCLIAVMLSAYALLDGYDLGAGAISLVLAKSRGDRSAIVESIGPFWSGNEVWLVAAGGTLFALFPKVYAVSFSGFYLPFIVVLWLLMFRGIAIELREQLPGDVWMDFWDTAFSISSLLLILLFGVTIGNLVRGLSLDRDAYFLGTFSTLLNPYALLVGVLAVLALVQHGLAYVAANIEGPLAERALRYIGRIWWLVIAAFIAVTAMTIAAHHADFPLASLAVAAGVVALGALVAVRYAARRGRARATFRASVVYVAAMLVSAGSTMYPYLIRPLPGSTQGLTVLQTSPPTLAVSLVIAVAGLVAVVSYSVFIRHRMPSKTAATE